MLETRAAEGTAASKGIAAARTAYRLVAEAIIGCTLVRVTQDGIGFRALFELFFRGRIVRVAVRVELHRELPVGPS